MRKRRLQEANSQDCSTVCPSRPPVQQSCLICPMVMGGAAGGGRKSWGKGRIKRKLARLHSCPRVGARKRDRDRCHPGLLLLPLWVYFVRSTKIIMHIFCDRATAALEIYYSTLFLVEVRAVIRQLKYIISSIFTAFIPLPPQSP